MFVLDEVWWSIVARAAVVYVAVLLGLRLTGKRQLGQMAPFDLVLVLLIANAVQNAMVGSDTSVTGGLLAGAVLLLLNLVVSRLNSRITFFQRLAEGSPVVLVAHGAIVGSALRREGVDESELAQAIREHGIELVDDVELAVLEVDGSISIVPKDQQVIRTQRRFRQLRPRG